MLFSRESVTPQAFEITPRFILFERNRVVHSQVVRNCWDFKLSPYLIINNKCFCSSSIESQSKVEVMELSDLHHPNCKINRKMNSDLGVGVGPDSCRRESESSDSILLSPEASKATEAVEFIAEHLRNEDLYIQVNLPII